MKQETTSCCSLHGVALVGAMLTQPLVFYKKRALETKVTVCNFQNKVSLNKNFAFEFVHIERLTASGKFQ